jgi:hypothetical protein
VPEPSAFESEMVVKKLFITICVSNYSRTDSNRRWGNISSSRVQTAVSTTHVCPVYVSRFALFFLHRLFRVLNHLLNDCYALPYIFL